MLRLFGFKWDDENNMIQCEKQAFDEFCEGHPKAHGLWRMEFPHLQRLDIIFGVDRANGAEVEDIDDAIDDLENNVVNLANETVELEDLTTIPSSSTFTKQKKRKITSRNSGKNDFSEKWANTMDDMNTHLDKIAKSMVAAKEREQAAQNREFEIMEQKKQLLSEIAMLDGISMDDAIDAARILSNNPSELDIFYSCPNDEWKVRYVLKIIHQ